MRMLLRLRSDTEVIVIEGGSDIEVRAVEEGSKPARARCPSGLIKKSNQDPEDIKACSTQRSCGDSSKDRRRMIIPKIRGGGGPFLNSQASTASLRGIKHLLTVKVTNISSLPKCPNRSPALHFRNPLHQSVQTALHFRQETPNPAQVLIAAECTAARDIDSKDSTPPPITGQQPSRYPAERRLSPNPPLARRQDL